MNDDALIERNKQLDRSSKRETLRRACPFIEGQAANLRDFIYKLDDGSPDLSLVSDTLTLVQTWAQAVAKECKGQQP